LLAAACGSTTPGAQPNEVTGGLGGGGASGGTGGGGGEGGMSPGAGGSGGGVALPTGGASGASPGGSGGVGGMAGEGGAGSGGAGGEGVSDSGVVDGDSGTELDPSCTGGEQPDFALSGWATQSGGTTGGKGGAMVQATSGAELVQALEDKQDSATPLTILVSGVITVASAGVDKIEVKDVSDVSIIGAGQGAELDGIGIKIVRASNIVIRNLRIHHVESGDKDAISIEGPADHIWIDHCELYAQYEGVDKDFYDGLLDAKAESEYITYSWNYLHDSWKAALVGSSEDDTFDRKLTAHHNWFHNVNSRLPLFRGGNGHVFNNYYLDIADTGINARIDACLRIEGNYFENAQNPYVSAFSDVLGGGELSCNVLAGSTAFAYADDVQELPSCTASVPYDYDAVLTHPERVPALVMANAGVGKLDDPTAF
jgi:pectate lyase